MSQAREDGWGFRAVNAHSDAGAIHTYTMLLLFIIHDRLFIHSLCTSDEEQQQHHLHHRSIDISNLNWQFKCSL